MNIKTLIKLTFFVIIIIIIIYIRVTKIPVLCLACEEPGTFTRCITGTGDGTVTCDAYRLQRTVVDGINTAFTEVENTFGKVIGPLEDAYTKIQLAKQTLTEAFEQIGSINIPEIPRIKIPDISNISCSIDFGAIPAIDICKTGISTGITKGAIDPMNTVLKNLDEQINNVVNTLNNTIGPINTSIDKVTGGLKDIVGGVNYTIDQIKTNLKKIGMNIDIPTINTNALNGLRIPDSGIGGVALPKLDNVDLSCDLNIPKLIKDKLGTASLDVCSLLMNEINNKLVPQLNIAFTTVENGINIAVTNINLGIMTAINAIKNGISTAILMLEQQLESLNIFGTLTTKMVELITKIETLNPIGLIKVYVLPYISAIIPFATLADTLAFLLFLVFVPFSIPFLLIINSLIDLIVPDIDIPIFKSTPKISLDSSD